MKASRKMTFQRAALAALKAAALKRVEASIEPAPEAACEVAMESLEEASDLALEALWPEAGVKVAVGVEALGHALRLGETGVSEGRTPEDVTEVFVRLDGPKSLGSLRIPVELLVPVGKPKRARTRALTR